VKPWVAADVDATQRNDLRPLGVRFMAADIQRHVKRQYSACHRRGFCHAILYLFTLTEVHTFDALSYISDVTRKPWQRNIHPNTI
jgi:hypothetical protein